MMCATGSMNTARCGAATQAGGRACSADAASSLRSLRDSAYWTSRTTSSKPRSAATSHAVCLRLSLIPNSTPRALP